MLSVRPQRTAHRQRCSARISYRCRSEGRSNGAPLLSRTPRGHHLYQGASAAPASGQRHVIVLWCNAHPGSDYRSPKRPHPQGRRSRLRLAEWRLGHWRAIGISMVILGFSLISLPWIGSRLHGSFGLGALGIVGTALAISVLIYAIMGCCRALGGVAITSTIMEFVPKHFMGRVQNTFLFAATLLQFGLSILVGAVAHKKSLALAFGIVGSLYLLACLTGAWPAKEPANETVNTAAKAEPQPAVME